MAMVALHGNCCHGSGCLGHYYMYFYNFFNSTHIVSIILYYFVMKVERNTQPLANNAREYMQFFYKLFFLMFLSLIRI